MSEHDDVRLAPTDPRVRWDGIDRLEPDGPGRRPLRLPPERLACALSFALEAAAEQAAGVRFSLRTDARAVTIRLHVDGGRSKPLDVLIGPPRDSRLVRTPTRPGENEVRVDLPAATGAPTDIEVWLPHNTGVRVDAITLHGASVVEREVADRPDWVAYGSSLTQSLAAAGPSETWSAIVARRNGWRLRNLGLSSQAHLDLAVARAIRDAPADLITLELGVNVYILASLTDRTLASAIGGFVATIRDGHPRTPIIVWGPFVSVEREEKQNSSSMTLRQVRELVNWSVTRLRAAGDGDLHLIDGAGLISGSDAGLLMDGLHPSAVGELVLADRMAEALASAVQSISD
ncbi:SGNH/GDSL hydrolase family protein [Actinospica robiniae]|uniref:SGNH/GDSL hydrolase family protein n=1 Tax=Actinospica robiniae TaxID=304901 RepID=UPI0004158CA6|nr:SGNH/GDSL hydrolase family protein [Actinospica robiniae]